MRECGEDNHDWQVGACGCAGRARGAYSRRRRRGDGLRRRERTGRGARPAQRAAASRVQPRDARGLLPDGCVPGLLGVARRPFAGARLYDRGRGRDAYSDQHAARIRHVINVAIVGAGPAGVAAADVLVAHGVAVTIIDEGREAGGQIYLRARAGLKLDIDALMGAETANYRSFHTVFERLRDRFDYQPETLVWGIDGKRLHTLRAGVADAVAFDALILATGATDRVLPVPGWTLPGVFTLGGSQIALKAQGRAIGTRVVFAGSGPLLYLVAWQYMKAGVEVAAVLDAAPLSAKFNLLRALPLAPGLVLRGLRMAAGLQLRGTPVHFGASRLRIEGEGRVARIVYH